MFDLCTARNNHTNLGNYRINAIEFRKVWAYRVRIFKLTYLYTAQLDTEFSPFLHESYVSHRIGTMGT